MTQIDAKEVIEVVLVAGDHVLDLVIVIDEQEAAQEIGKHQFSEFIFAMSGFYHLIDWLNYLPKMFDFVVEGEADPEQVNQKTVRKTQSIQNLK